MSLASRPISGSLAARSSLALANNNTDDNASNDDTNDKLDYGDY